MQKMIWPALTEPALSNWIVTYTAGSKLIQRAWWPVFGLIHRL